MPRHLAVLIGISEYTHYEIATGRPPGALRLRGAVHDACGYARMLRRLGVTSADTRLLVSPAPTPEMFGVDTLPIAEATRAAIEAAFSWLGQELAADPDAIGIVSFSGHGDLSAEGDYTLYPMDITPGQAGLSLRALAAALPEDGRCVLLLDTCRTGARLDGERSDVPDLATIFRPSNTIMMLSATPGQRAMERCFDGRWQGVWSWSVQRVVEQWQATAEGFGLSYRVLHERAAQIVAALSAHGAQTPALLALPAHQERAFLGGEQTSTDPTRAGFGSELPTDTIGIMLATTNNDTIGAFQVRSNGNKIDWFSPSGSNPFIGLSHFRVRFFTSYSSMTPSMKDAFDSVSSNLWKTFYTQNFPNSPNNHPLQGVGAYINDTQTLALALNGSEMTWYAASVNSQTHVLDINDGDTHHFVWSSNGTSGAFYVAVDSQVT